MADQFLESDSGKDYADLMNKAKTGNVWMDSVEIKSAEDYDKMRMFVSSDGSSGVALNSEGG